MKRSACLAFAGLWISWPSWGDSLPSLSAATPPASLSSVSLQAQSDTPVVLDLADTVALALRDNRALRSRYLERVAQRFELRVAQDRFAPQFSLGARYLVERNDQDRYRQAELGPGVSLLTPFGTRLSLDWAATHQRADRGGPRFDDGANLSLIQPLLRGAGFAAAGAPLRQAQLAEQLNRLALKDEVARAITAVIGLHRDLGRAQAQVQLAQAALVRARRLVEINQALISSGRMAAFDILQAEADVANQELAVEDARDRVHGARQSLLQALALDLATPVRVNEPPPATRVHVDAAQALARAEALQPRYLMGLLALERARLDLDMARDAQRWDLSLIAGTRQARQRPGATRTWGHYLGITVDVPIGDLGLRQGEVRAEIALAQQALSQADLHQQLRRDVADGVRDLGVRWRRWEIAGRAVALSERKVDVEREKLALGRSSNFQLVSYEADLRAAQQTHLDAGVAYLEASTALDLVLGTTLETWEVSLVQ